MGGRSVVVSHYRLSRAGTAKHSNFIGRGNFPPLQNKTGIPPLRPGLTPLKFSPRAPHDGKGSIESF
jgi:hypothetical protein